MPKNFVKLERIDLKSHPELKETWVQQVIAGDPSILGLGDLILKDKERPQVGAGRLDLLLQDVDSNHRYEVEIQLGKTNETHLVRTIEYWDLERRRYPQYDHTAVIIAEDITGRFLNVITLFNGHIPIIAIQMSAFKLGNDVSLVFTKVVDVVKLGLLDEDEEVSETTDRAYWESRGSKATVKLADEALEIVKRILPDLELKYNKFYIGLAKNGVPSNFAMFRPQKSAMKIEIKLKQTDEIDRQIEEEGLDIIDYDRRRERYRLKVTAKELQKHAELLEKLFKLSAEEDGRLSLT